MQMAQQGNAKQGLSVEAPHEVQETWLLHSSVAADALITIHEHTGIIERIEIIPVLWKASGRQRNSSCQPPPAACFCVCFHP